MFRFRSSNENTTCFIVAQGNSEQTIMIVYNRKIKIFNSKNKNNFFRLDDNSCISNILLSATRDVPIETISKETVKTKNKNESCNKYIDNN